MSKVIPCNYTGTELKNALISLAVDDSTQWTNDCQHIHGFNSSSTFTNSTDYFFVDNHELSMLQTITARRVLDYQKLVSNPEAPTEEQLLSQTQQFHKQNGKILNLITVIKTQQPSMALAAEFKRASPSKGDIAPNLKVSDQALNYVQAGASTISILTEEHYFKRSLQDLTDARLTTTQWANSQSSSDEGSTRSRSRPAILRKDFCISKYMILEALASGADTILLIVAITPKALLKELISFCRIHSMEPLVEVHAKVELDVALESGAKVIGVNNRNLHTFQMDLSTTDHTTDALGQRGCNFFHLYKDDNNDDNKEEKTTSSTSEDEYALCALSGMSSANDVHRYRQKGVGMCLIGESLMRAVDPKSAIQNLCLDPQDYFATEMNTSCSAYTNGMKIVKVCGITNSEDALVACRNGANLIGVIFVPKSKRCVNVDQAKDVVNTVRTFGERSNRVTFPSNLEIGNDGTALPPLHTLTRKARAMEDLSKRPLVVGVFQNQSHEFIREMVDVCGLDLIQLHGKEGMEAANVDKCSAPAIRVVDIETSESSEVDGDAADAVQKILNKVTNDPIAILLDTSIQGSKDGGGTGVTFDWSISEKLQNHGLPVIIAGGLKPNNVKDAVGSVRPWGIDVSSGVEERPGKKDHGSVEAFVRGAREAAVEASKGF